MKRCGEEKLEIANYPNFITIMAFQRGMLRNSDLFDELPKIMPYTMEEAYIEAKKFVNLEREVKLSRQKE